MGGDRGEHQKSVFQENNTLPHYSSMLSSQNINSGTVAPTVVNLESIPVDSDLEEDLEEIQ